MSEESCARLSKISTRSHRRANRSRRLAALSSTCDSTDATIPFPGPYFEDADRVLRSIAFQYRLQILRSIARPSTRRPSHINATSAGTVRSRRSSRLDPVQRPLLLTSFIVQYEHNCRLPSARVHGLSPCLDILIRKETTAET